MSQLAKENIRIIFMGTSSFAVPLLERLVFDGYNISAVVTKPDSKIGRKQQVEVNQVKSAAHAHKLKVIQFEKIDDKAVSQLKDLRASLIVVAAFGKILPPAVLQLPEYGCLNVHPSLLPKFRGPSPIQNCLMLGCEKTGTTIMLMDSGMDTGDILAQAELDIDPSDTSRTLGRKLSETSADLLSETLPKWIARELQTRKQDDSQATLCQMIEREDGHIYWNNTAVEIYNLYRALYGWPGIFTLLKRGYELLRIKLIKISYSEENASIKRKIGEVFEYDGKIAVQTMQGLIILHQVQLESKKPVEIREFLNGYRDLLGAILQ